MTEECVLLGRLLLGGAGSLSPLRRRSLDAGLLHRRKHAEPNLSNHEHMPKRSSHLPSCEDQRPTILKSSSTFMIRHAQPPSERHRGQLSIGEPPCTSDEQRRTAEDTIDDVDESGPRPGTRSATEVVPSGHSWEA